ncbi:glutathione peroxidase [Trichosporon asahii var. asahii CBS 8904]|uniref:Glutathione peroxidase n=1 Tax=Trichosporon asahii var. asahii (strain CBS 8904) TaxID=1220162 RepID=K1VCE4_TRIAC|nr:glutathione peroxidase [Trichosporon asahii var. asahii CBS 8904]
MSRRLATFSRHLSTSSKASSSPDMFGAIKSKLGYENLPADAGNKSFYDLKAQLPGQDKYLDFSTLKGKVVLIVNTASKCGFTPQLYKDYHDRGFEVIGFPSNEFNGQEPGNDEQIAEFCQSKVNGPDMNEVFAWLKSQNAPGAGGVAGTTSIKWNFTKFLVDKNGKLVDRFGSTTTPASIAPKIEKLLNA